MSELAEALDASHANVSKHLNLLLGERMVARRREGQRAVYTHLRSEPQKLCDEVCTRVRDSLRELHELVGEPDNEEPTR